jgi:hypothetical protein
MIVGHQAGSYDSEANFGDMRHGGKSIQAVSGNPPCRCLRAQAQLGGLEYMGLGHGSFRSPKTAVDRWRTKRSPTMPATERRCLPVSSTKQTWSPEVWRAMPIEVIPVIRAAPGSGAAGLPEKMGSSSSCLRRVRRQDMEEKGH